MPVNIRLWEIKDAHCNLYYSYKPAVLPLGTCLREMCERLHQKGNARTLRAAALETAPEVENLQGA